MYQANRSLFRMGLSAMVLGTVFASAMGQSSPGTVLAFGPAIIGPDQPSGDVNHILIGLLLPAVQTTKLPYRVEIVNQDMDLLIGVTGRTTRFNQFFDVFLSQDRQGVFYIHVKDLATGQDRIRKTSFLNVTIRILPAVQDDTGEYVSPLSASATGRGFKPFMMGDGSVLPLPFESVLPAVQSQQK